MGQSVTAYEQFLCDAGTCLNATQTVSLVPEGESLEGSTAGEIVMDAKQSFLYVTNRGKRNTVTVFSIDESGMLEQRQQMEVPAFPRGMTLALGDRILLEAGQSKSEVVSYGVGDDGLLKATGFKLTEGLPSHPAALALFNFFADSIVV